MLTYLLLFFPIKTFTNQVIILDLCFQSQIFPIRLILFSSPFMLRVPINQNAESFLSNLTFIIILYLIVTKVI